MEELVTEKVQSILESYYKMYPEQQRIEVDIFLTENLNATHSKLRPDASIDPECADQLDYNGRMVVPVSLDERISILLNLNKIVEYTEDGSLTWIGTIAHELTHAIDYYRMARIEGLREYVPLENPELYCLFQLWTEYHARNHGYRFLRNFLDGLGRIGSRESQIYHIRNTEWPFQRDAYSRQYQLETERTYQQMYLTMQILGRYSVWCDLFPEEFNAEEFSEQFSDMQWMYKLLVFLRENEELEQFITHKNVFASILQENWDVYSLI